ncbi:MAG: glycosyltransferase family 2 protein [Alphaproteobacteria bacterium]|nr:glycosyltransferase family 2 protein [Alphaproteobacteria bacterium]
MKISVVSPFFNEQAIIATAARVMIDRLASRFEDWELILVDDGSRDDSLARLTSALTEADAAHVRVLSYPANKGRGHALKTGIDAATGDIIVTTETDLSWGEDIVERLVAVLTADPDVDVVVASVHMAGGGLANVPPHRVFLTNVGNQLIRSCVSRELTMYTGMTRAYRREVIQPLEVHERGKEFHLEVILKLMTLGFVIREIPATITWAVGKQDKKPTRKSSTKLFQTIVSHLRFSLVGKPSQYFGLAALASAAAAALFLGWALINLLTGAVAAYAATVGLILAVMALTFGGFSALFTELREILRGQWAASYPSSLQRLVSARKVRRAFPPEG